MRHWALNLVVLVLGAVFFVAACTWVKPTPEGETVQVSNLEGVAGCERRGQVTVSLKDKIAGMNRKRAKVESELETLARNEGALMGGDTVAAASDIEEGRQVFGVYNCLR